MIPVTKPYLPSREKIDNYIDDIYNNQWLTNNGPLVQELTKRLENYLGVENLLLVVNGTLALQIAYRALGITRDEEYSEAITTPFTFAATASSLKWEGVEPIFTDIDSDTWCLNPRLIEKALTPHTRAIVPVHVFGNACEVEEIDKIGRQHALKVVYDASHAFGVSYKGESLLKYGDASTLSFHATKLFHTIEGGAIVFKSKADLEYAKKLINFGIPGVDSIENVGINAKMNEFQAAMGLCVLDEIELNLLGRKKVSDIYTEALSGYVKLQKLNEFSTQNYAYFPIIMKDEETVRKTIASLKSSGISARRYFSPSLDTLSKIYKTPMKTCYNSRDISKRIICLPIYSSLDIDAVVKVVETLDNFKY